MTAVPGRVVMVFTLLALLALACAPPARRPQAVWAGEVAMVSLEYRGEARAVYASGDFNEWNPFRHPFSKGAGDRWICELQLEAGEYRYLIGVETDSGWSLRPDPANPDRVRDGAGRELSLLAVGAGGGNANTVDD